MAAKTVQHALGLCCLTLVAVMTGCGYPLNTTYGPTPQFPVPIPVSPFFQDQYEDKYWMKERYERVPVLGPITSGGPAVALDPPSEDEIIRALIENQHIEGGLPFLCWQKKRREIEASCVAMADPACGRERGGNGGIGKLGRCRGHVGYLWGDC